MDLQTKDKQTGGRFRSEHNIPPDAFLIGTTGKLETANGQRDFTLAANTIAQKHANAHFVVAGKDASFTQAFRRELKRLVKIFGLEARFLWLDFVGDTTVFFSALDVFVAASHAENSRQAISDAIAAGCAVVATETGNIKDLLENGKTVKLVAVKEPIQIAEAVGELIKQKN